VPVGIGSSSATRTCSTTPKAASASSADGWALPIGGGGRGVADALALERIDADDRGRGQFARSAKPGLWRRNLSPAAQDLIAGIIGPKLEELGYP